MISMANRLSLPCAERTFDVNGIEASVPQLAAISQLREKGCHEVSQPPRRITSKVLFVSRIQRSGTLMISTCERSRLYFLLLQHVAMPCVPSRGNEAGIRYLRQVHGTISHIRSGSRVPGRGRRVYMYLSETGRAECTSSSLHG